MYSGKEEDEEKKQIILENKVEVAQVGGWNSGNNEVEKPVICRNLSLDQFGKKKKDQNK